MLGSSSSICSFAQSLLALVAPEMAVYKAKVIERSQDAENNIQTLTESMCRALQTLDDMSTRSVPPELIHTLTWLEEQIAQISQQVSAVESKVDEVLTTQQRILEKLENILPPGDEPGSAEALADMKIQYTQLTHNLDMVVAEISNRVHLFAGMLSEPSSKHQNNAPDDEDDVPEPVGHSEEHVPAASNFGSTQWTQEPEPVGHNEEHVPAASNFGYVPAASNFRSIQWTPGLDMQDASNSWQEAAGDQRLPPQVTNITPSVAAASISGRQGHSWQQAGGNKQAATRVPCHQ